MRTETFKSILEAVVEMKGGVPSKDLRVETAAAYTRFINLRVRQALEYAMWPECMKVERRQYRNSWSGELDYEEGDEVFNEADEQYYVALQDNSDAQPDESEDDWEIQDELNKYITPDPDDDDLTPIGEVDSITSRDPYLTTTPGFLQFSLSADGIQMHPNAPARPYVKFRLRPPVFTSTPWDSNENYAAAALVYYATTGECYKAIQANTNQNPSTMTDYWTKVDFPYIFSSFVQLAVYSDALRNDGQIEKALAVYGDQEDPAPGTAYYELVTLYDVIFTQQSQYTVAQVVRR